MAGKKKNSNYVTEKTVQKKAIAAEKKRIAKRNKTLKAIIIPVAAILLIAAVIFGIMMLGGAFDYVPEATDHVSIALSGYDTTLHVELYGKDAPESAKGFLARVSSHYYDGKTVTAYIDGSLYFGDEAIVDTGIKGEFSANGIDNKIPIKAGTLVMARGEDYDSAYSRFFIVTEDTDISALKGNYAPFGRVTGGMEVIEEIISKLTPNSDGAIPEGEQPVINSISTHVH